MRLHRVKVILCRHKVYIIHLNITRKRNIMIYHYRVAEILDYTADELTGMNMYTLCHGEDVGKLRKCHLDRKYKIYLPTIIGTYNT